MSRSEAKISAKIESLAQLIETVHQLRAPGGCPWDRAQTHQSLRPYLIEEAYEVIDVIDQIHSNDDLKTPSIAQNFREELGDLLMQVILHSEMTQEQGVFDIYDVAKGLNEKLIRRHPHVFGETKEASAEAAVQRWEKEKLKEKKGNLKASVLDGIPKGMPSLQRSTRVIEKVTRVGFQWDDMTGPLAKVEEELRELKQEVLALEKLNKNNSSKNIESETAILKKRIESELGDLLFTLSNVAHLNRLNPEDALRGTLNRFERRFRHVENRLKWKGKSPEQSNLAEMDQFWDEAKALEKISVWGLTGGIASGKSSVAQFFQEAGLAVIDADQISRELSQPGGAAYEALMNRFGTTDRKQIRALAFSDPKAKSDLEAILHPLIAERSTEEILRLGKTNPIIIYEATLLVETGRSSDFRGLITVESTQDLQITRLLERSRSDSEMNEALARSIIQNQATSSVRSSKADWVIENTSSLSELKQKTQVIAKALLDQVRL